MTALLCRDLAQALYTHYVSMGENSGYGLGTRGLNGTGGY